VVDTLEVDDAGSCLMCLNTSVAQVQYRITDLGTLGRANSIPIWITNTGDVIGISDTGQFDSFGNLIDGRIPLEQRSNA